MLEFKEEGHIYLLDGKQIPSVTEIIQKIGLSNFDGIPKAILDRKARLGKSIHKTLEYFDNNILDEEKLHPTLKMYLDGWKLFLKQFKPEIIAVEKKFYHNKFHYAGTVDRIFKFSDNYYIIDIKTGDENKYHRVQTAAYKDLAENQDEYKKIKFKRMIVYLIPEQYRIIEHKNDREDLNVFLSCLTIYNFTKKG